MKSMSLLNRRSFIKSSVVAASFAAGFPRSAWAQPSGANNAIRIAVVGLGNQGTNHLKRLLPRKDVRITALCDVDPQRVTRAVELLEGKLSPFTTTDAREVFARPDVDAVMIVTCNHWHALHTIWACDAGKDVYVEKPMSHTVWEGRKMVEAAARNKCIVQVGTHYRSGKGIAEAIQYVRDGNLGKIQNVHAPAYLKRGAISRRRAWYPDSLDYDRFCGPAPMVPLEREKLHYDWHWMWGTGNGELGNNGVHFLDLALRLLPHTNPPRRVLSIAGRFGSDNDVAETPNTQLVVYDFPEFPILYENRALPAQPGVNYMDQVGGIRYGIVANCEGGYLSGLTGLTAYDPKGKVIQKFAAGGGSHLDNFLEAVRKRRPQDLAAPVEVGHASAAVCHYGNISYRLGKSAGAARVAKALEAIPAAAEIGRSLQQHLGMHGIDLEKQRFSLGPWLDLDHTGDAIVAVESGFESRLPLAQHLLRETPRPPYVIPS